MWYLRFLIYKLKLSSNLVQPSLSIHNRRLKVSTYILTCHTKSNAKTLIHFFTKRIKNKIKNYHLLATLNKYSKE